MFKLDAVRKILFSQTVRHCQCFDFASMPRPGTKHEAFYRRSISRLFEELSLPWLLSACSKPAQRSQTTGMKKFIVGEGWLGFSAGAAQIDLAQGLAIKQ